VIRFPPAPIVLILAAAAAGCKPPATNVAPSEPVAAVERLLAGVQANDLQAMGEAWGSSRGPANRWMETEERHKRLTIIRSFLAHESFAFEERGILPGNSPNERVVRVRLTRRGCKPVVPFTTVRYGGGWIVSAIDLEAAGNPARSCR
jgi:hypothetical protein